MAMADFDDLVIWSEKALKNGHISWLTSQPLSATFDTQRKLDLRSLTFYNPSNLGQSPTLYISTPARVLKPL